MHLNRKTGINKLEILPMDTKTEYKINWDQFP